MNQQLRSTNITDITSLRFNTPGFSSVSGTGYTQIYIRGIGNGSPGPLALLDDITNGGDSIGSKLGSSLNYASAGYDNNGAGLPAAGSGRPSSGAFFNNNSDGDYRGRTCGTCRT